ncbi:TNT domain-containing protein [Mycobacterium sp. SP-6446]|uniref:TNT domain-containing protein n=1 Tax=Mycobacterium sp. SP-6446 TaxID=1834162 RepID=UPI00096C37C9|nr:TNT domain-containing protein [Mycobacterium sp. SP-6446]OMC16465.1 NAD(+)--arginine ADP-ribosyltransferase [Mycobacterium sp. SP-6446]
MAPLAVDTAALDSAGAEVVTAGEGLGSVISTLTAVLSGCAGMAGDDPAGAALGRSYDSSAAKLVQAMVVTRNGLCGLGVGVRMSAHNYSLAEAQSDVSGHGSPLPAPRSTGPISAGSPPSSVGTGDGAPAGWGWVAPFIGMIWPSADSGMLRAAAAAWSAAGTQFAVAEILGTGGPMGAIRGQQIPEGPAIDRAFTEAYSSTTGIVQQSQKIAAQLSDYAAKVDQVHAAILDLLARICDPMTGIKEVWDILTDEDEDEIKKIADDIRTVVDRFTAEVDALRAEIAATVREAETILTTMGDYASREWDQFLHGTDVGRAINQVGQYAKGVYSEAGGFVKGLYDISQLRLLFDPVGYARDMGGMVQGSLPLVGLGPDRGPGVVESWKQLGKGLAHWDEWKTNPAEAAGKSVFDLVTLALPGGPLSKIGKVGHGALDALGRLKPGELPKPPSIKPPTVEPPRVEPPTPKPPEPGPKPPEPGRPAPAPPGKPTPPPPGSPLPHGPTESRPPVEPPHGGEPPKPTSPPHESPTQVSAPAEGKPPPHGSGAAPAAAPAERTPPHPPPHERVPAAVSAPAAGAPAESVPSAAVPSASAPAASAPSLPEPHLSSPSSAAAGGLPAEAPPPFGGTPHGGEPGAHPPEPPKPGDGAPRQPGDGDAPAGSHPPDDASPADDPAHEHQPGHTTPSDLPPYRQAQVALAESPEQLVRDLVEHGCPRDIAESALHNPYSGMNAQEILNQFWDPAKATWKWPEANGFADGKWETARSIPKEAWLDRIGEVSGERGDFMGTVGDSYPQRGLAPGSSGDYNRFHGTGKELPDGWEVRYGKVAEAFGQPGGGTQWVVVDKDGQIVLIKFLIDEGYLDWG